MRVEISGQKFSLPIHCACCVGPAETELAARASRSRGKRVVHTTTRGWAFPYCSTCVRHVQLYQGASQWAVAVGFGAGVVASFIRYQMTDGDSFFLAGLLTAIACGIAVLVWRRSIANKVRHSACATADMAVRYLGWQGSLHVFDFDSTEYAARFMEQNLKKLVNVTASQRNLLLSRDGSDEGA